MASGLASGVVFSVLALAVVSSILTVPVHAIDDNTVSITVDPSAELKPTGNLYKATANVAVKTGKPYGFNLTMQADTADLVNSKDSTHKISAPQSATPVALGANQWGYSLNKSATTFSAVPTTQVTPVVVADVTKTKPAGCTDPASCTKSVTFAANVDPAKLASGSYSTAITYTATAKPAPKPVDWQQRTAKTNQSDICRSGDKNSSCLVDLDPNMIPVIYTGNKTNAKWTSVANPEAPSSGWYDYANKQWANAITVKSEALSKYCGLSKVVDQADILGFWVYIPRYRYKVLRYSGSDPAVSAQNFTIEFENNQSIKAIPTANGTWATHPAFTFGTKELNGIWFGKFETTGGNSNPTVLPGKFHISYYNVGAYYSVAKSIGVYDSQNVGGNSVTATQNSHNLAKFSSRMVNNSDWGAATYLSASKYGASYNGVHINPSDDNTGYNYNTSDGQLTSTTNNPTGIYDMSGGGEEYVAASYSDNLNNSNTNDNFGSIAAHPPYVNTYNFKDFNSCTYQTCGGQALYETHNGLSRTRSNMWLNQTAYFVGKDRYFYPWFRRGGGGYIDGLDAGLFYAGSGPGVGGGHGAFRVALAPAPHD